MRKRTTRMLYEYTCPEHGTFEHYCRLNDREAPKPCPKCQVLSPFKISAPRSKLEGISGDFPTAADQWAKKHERWAKGK